MRHRVLAAAAVAVALPVPSAQADDACASSKRVERVARKACSKARPVPCIRRAALHWNVSVGLLIRKARCESRLKWWASNGSHAGLFQFRVAFPSTWATTPYADESPWSPKWSALAAGWMHHVGRGSEWSCR